MINPWKNAKKWKWNWRIQRPKKAVEGRRLLQCQYRLPKKIAEPRITLADCMAAALFICLHVGSCLYIHRFESVDISAGTIRNPFVERKNSFNVNVKWTVAVFYKELPANRSAFFFPTLRVSIKTKTKDNMRKICSITSRLILLTSLFLYIYLCETGLECSFFWISTLN